MNDKNRATDTTTDMESNTKHELLGEIRASSQNSRVDIYVRSYRRLNSDPDGISAKAALDGIVARGILPDDSTKQVKKITFETIKNKEEKTVIEIKQMEE